MVDIMTLQEIFDLTEEYSRDVNNWSLEKVYMSDLLTLHNFIKQEKLGEFWELFEKVTDFDYTSKSENRSYPVETESGERVTVTFEEFAGFFPNWTTQCQIIKILLGRW